MLGLQSTVLSDRRRRRPHAWTCGAPVVLADGTRWFLPRIDLQLLGTTEFLQAELLHAAELARSTRGATAFSPHLVECPVHLGDIGRRLLRINYDLSREESLSLLRFEEPEGRFRFARSVGSTLREAAADWASHLDRDVAVLGNSRN